ncbi:MAG TPA: hypothetical protein VFD02_00400 [Syntrophomonadaceae bacterium]|nr:hypothetical protein [Syntrophomonadaceae bacterium]
MKKWGKGDPVNLSDLLKITPVANEIMQLSEELDMSITDIIWIASQIIDSSEEINEDFMLKVFDEEDDDITIEDWDDIDLESLEDDIEQAMYIVNVKINSEGRFPEIGFKAGVNEKEDIHYFFDMVMDMLDKLE